MKRRTIIFITSAMILSLAGCQDKDVSSAPSAVMSETAAFDTESVPDLSVGTAPLNTSTGSGKMSSAASSSVSSKAASKTETAPKSSSKPVSSNKATSSSNNSNSASVQQTASKQPSSQKTASEKPSSQKTVIEKPSSQETMTEQPSSQETMTEQPSSQETVIEQAVPQETITVTEYPAQEETTTTTWETETTTPGEVTVFSVEFEPEEVTPFTPSENGYIEKVLELVNIEREKVGAPPLSLDGKLCSAAQVRAEELTEFYDPNHKRPDGRDSLSIISEFGIKSSACAENIAHGEPTPEMVVKDWLESEHHRVSMLSSDYTRMGVGYAEKDTDSTEFAYYWSQLFSN